MPIEFATAAFATPGKAVPAAIAAEQAGFDIFLLTDSQCLRGEWGLQQVREGARAAGRNPDQIPVGAYVNVCVDQDEAAARNAIKGGAATFAHFSASIGADFEHQPDIMRAVTEKLVTEYDTNRHTQGEAPHVQYLSDEFIDWFAAAGNASKVIERLAPLVGLGLNHLYFVGPWSGLTEAVMPELRRLSA